MTLTHTLEPTRGTVPVASARRFCAARLELIVVDLGMSPLCQTVVRPEELEQTEPFSLHVPDPGG
jgi:hypothetical protein